MLEDAGFQALLVGGCVRNALLGAPVSDIDISTNAHPERVRKIAKSAGLKSIPTGIEHGTITVVADGIPHEITTFRKDVETDGRRAVVAFSDRVEDDAHRRDFTMNAIYAHRDGTVVDPLGGMTDLQDRKFRFIDNADQRIREDYLRILRYFRFHAWYGDPNAGMDAEALAAIAANTEGLGSLSAERITSELMKLLSAQDPAPSVAAMRQCGVLSEVLVGADDRALAPLVHFEGAIGANIDPIARLAALGGPEIAKNLRLSKKQSAKHALLREAVSSTDAIAVIAFKQDEQIAILSGLLRSSLLEMPIQPDLTAQARRGTKAVFPIHSSDLSDQFQGRELGVALRKLEAEWIASDFKLTKAQLLR